MGTKAQGQGMKDHPSAGVASVDAGGTDCSHFLEFYSTLENGNSSEGLKQRSNGWEARDDGHGREESL